MITSICCYIDRFLGFYLFLLKVIYFELNIPEKEEKK